MAVAPSELILRLPKLQAIKLPTPDEKISPKENYEKESNIKRWPSPTLENAIES